MRTEYRSPSPTFRSFCYYLFCPLLRNVCQSIGNALIYTSVFVARKRAFSEPLSNSGLFCHNTKCFGGTCYLRRPVSTILETEGSSKTSVSIYQTPRRYIPEDMNFKPDEQKQEYCMDSGEHI
jgi:hypothetical protein